MTKLLTATIIAVVTAAALVISLGWWIAFRLVRWFLRTVLPTGPPR